MNLDHSHDHDDHDDHAEGWSKAEAYGYGTLANLLITLTSLAGIFIILYTRSFKENGYWFSKIEKSKVIISFRSLI